MPEIKRHNKSKKARTKQLGLFCTGDAPLKAKRISPKYRIDLDLDEKEMQKKIKSHAWNKYHLRLETNSSGSMTGSNGTTYTVGTKGKGDLGGNFCSGLYVEVEVKNPKGGTWAVSQQERKKVIEDRGGVYLGPVCNCAEFDDAIYPYMRHLKRTDWNSELLDEVTEDLITKKDRKV